MLEFIPETHTYLWEGQKVPSVTQVIEDACPFPWHDANVERAAEFGRVLHKTTQLHDLGELDTYDPALGPWMKAWKRYLMDLENRRHGLLVVDIKSGAFSKSWYPQMAAYENLYREAEKSCEPIIEKRYYSKIYGYAGTVDRIYQPKMKRGTEREAVQLLKTGDYKIYASPNTWQADFNVFVSMLNVYNWKKGG